MLKAVIFFILLVGIWEIKGEVDCENDVSQCLPNPPEYMGIPASVEETDRKCPKFMKIVECMNEYVYTCDSEIHPDSFTPLLPDLLAFLRVACDKDSDIHAEIVKHISCLRSYFDNPDEACIEASANALSSYMEKNEVGDGEDNSSAIACYEVSSPIACYNSQIEGNCEEGAKNFVLDVLRRTKYLDKICPKQNVEKHMQLLEALELNAAMKDRIKELLEN